MRLFDYNTMHPRDQIAVVISRIYQMGLTTSSGGNVSVADEEKNIWITPSGIDKGLLKREDIMCVKTNGTTIGKHKVSSEFPFHKAIYKSRPDIKAIIHAHPPALVSFSIVRQIPDTSVIIHARKICGPIGYAKYEIPASIALAEKIAEEFSKGYNAIIMENHGAVVGGRDIRDAFRRFEILESCAQTIINGKKIGKINCLSARQIKKYEAATPPPLPEFELVSTTLDQREKNKTICEFARRAYKQKLIVGSYDSISIRSHGNNFQITPANIPLWDLDLNDIVQIKDGKKERGKIPTPLSWLHQQIYKNNNEINSIIITLSPYLMAYAITNSAIDVRIIPESWIFLQHIPTLPFGVQFEKATSLLAENPLVIVGNDSVIIGGNTLQQTFDRLEVAEFSAKSAILGLSLGKIIPIDNEKIEELKKVFIKKYSNVTLPKRK